MDRRRHWSTTITACLIAATLSGCLGSDTQPKIGRDPRPADLVHMRRVVMIELPSTDGYPGIAKTMTTSLYRAIQDRKLFMIELVRPTDAICRDLPLYDRQSYSLEELAQIQKTLGCDALLVGQVKDFQPHPRMQIGVYMLLLDLNNGRAVWAVDHTWDSTDQWTVRRIKKFFSSQMRGGYDPIGWELTLRSPRVVSKFVAGEIAGRLPAVGPRAPRPRLTIPDSIMAESGL